MADEIEEVAPAVDESGEKPGLEARIAAAMDKDEEQVEQPKAEEPKVEEQPRVEEPQLQESDIARFNAAVAELRSRHESLSQREKSFEKTEAQLSALKAAIEADDPVAFVDFLDELGLPPEKIVDFFMTAGKPTDREQLRNKREAQKALKEVEKLRKELADRESNARLQAEIDQKHSEVRQAKVGYGILGKLPDEMVISTVEATAKAFNEAGREWGGDVKVLMSAVEGQLLHYAKLAGFTKAEMAEAVEEQAAAPAAKPSLIEEAEEDEVDEHVEQAKKAVRRRPPSELTGDSSGGKKVLSRSSNGRHLSLKDRIDNAARKFGAR